MDRIGLAAEDLRYAWSKRGTANGTKTARRRGHDYGLHRNSLRRLAAPSAVDSRPSGFYGDASRIVGLCNLFIEELGLSVYTVRSWIASRRLAHLRLGRAIRVPAEEIRRVIEQSTVPADRK